MYILETVPSTTPKWCISRVDVQLHPYATKRRERKRDDAMRLWSIWRWRWFIALACGGWGGQHYYDSASSFRQPSSVDSCPILAKCSNKSTICVCCSIHIYRDIWALYVSKVIYRSPTSQHWYVRTLIVTVNPWRPSAFMRPKSTSCRARETLNGIYYIHTCLKRHSNGYRSEEVMLAAIVYISHRRRQYYARHIGFIANHLNRHKIVILTRPTI